MFELVQDRRLAFADESETSPELARLFISNFLCAFSNRAGYRLKLCRFAKETNAGDAAGARREALSGGTLRNSTQRQHWKAIEITANIR